MDLNAGRFLPNGHCGYVLKPLCLRCPPGEGARRLALHIRVRTPHEPAPGPGGCHPCPCWVTAMTSQCPARCHLHLFPGDTNPPPSQVPPNLFWVTPTPCPARCHPYPLRVMPTPCPARCHSHTFSWLPPTSLAGDTAQPLTSVWVPPTCLLLGVPKSSWYQPCPFSEMASATSLLSTRPQSQPSATHIPSPGDPAICHSVLSPGWYQPPPSSSPHPHSWLGAICFLLGTPTLSPAMCHLRPFSWMAPATSLLLTPSTLLTDNSPG